MMQPGESTLPTSREREQEISSASFPCTSTPAPRIRSGMPTPPLSTTGLLKYNAILQHLKQKEFERNESNPLTSSSSSSSFSSSLLHSTKSVIPTLSIESLSNLSLDLQTFLENNYGKEAAAKNITNSFVKLPTKLFRDYTITGPLNAIFKILLKAIDKKKWIDLNILREDRKNEVISIIVDIEKMLIEKNYLVWPVVKFSPDMDAAKVAELTEIVLSHRGKVVESPEEATHLIEWDDEVDGKNRHMGEVIRDPNEEDYIRTLELQPFRIRNDSDGKENVGIGLVHWWYHPDSYDEYIPLKGEDVQYTDPPDTHLMPPGRKWKVCCKFILDVATYNEWGNELDYEIEKGEINPELDITSSGSKKIKKKQATKQPENPLQEYVIGSLLFTEKMNQNIVPITDNPNVESVKVVEVETNLTNNTNDMSYKFIKPKGSSERKRANQDAEGPIKNTDTQDSPPDWFSNTTIHVNEIKVMSIFFDQTCSLRTPSAYMRIRNVIYELYRSNPAVYLTATEARKKMSGDVCTITHVHSFMDAYGIVNYACTGPRPFLIQHKDDIPLPSHLQGNISNAYRDDDRNEDRALYQKSLNELTGSDLFMSGKEMEQRLSSKFSDRLLAAVGHIKKRSRHNIDEDFNGNTEEDVNVEKEEVINVYENVAKSSTDALMGHVQAIKKRVDLIDKIEDDMEADRVSLKMESRDLMLQQVKINRGYTWEA